MPDLPDWYKTLLQSNRFPLSELGELAPRLGSPVTYDRRGEVLWFDVMDKGLAPWSVSTVGSGSGVKVSTEAVFHGGYSLKLTGDDSTFDIASISHGFGPLHTEVIGVEAAVAFDDTFRYFRMFLTRYDGTTRHRAAVRLDYDNLVLQYLNASAAWVDLIDVPQFRFDLDPFNHVKMVVDFDGDLYERVLYNNEREVDIGAVIYSSALATNPSVTLSLDYQSELGEVHSMWVGHVILTSNEP